ncbi:putative toxin-antitoxin system toxin component, PIN family [Aequorivita capsosiphonis]|uniref:putative toxin-antitoxin system toxin component, PIN family n=1 Tax=Aequorivita capsosiphonis TaxID=487317 RepID=UPI000429822E|nr:putative toxin-antitoxin system toxin component, PIN family [Aequorivita capsosiphonis]
MNERFVFDTNTLISSFLFKDSVPRKAFIRVTNIGDFFASLETISEFKDVLFRSKFDKYLKPGLRGEAYSEIIERIIFVDITESITACHDSKDDKFLELAVAAKASCLITGDNDLLVLNPFRSISILNPSDFLNHF